MNRSVPARLVAITGGSGSGKTWLADRLHGLFGARAGRLCQDNFYRDRSHLPAARRCQVNFDHPDALDWDSFGTVLEDLVAGRAARLPTYDFATHCRLAGGAVLEPRPVVLVDGLWLLHRPEIRRLFHLRIFLQCPGDERLRRRLVRDTAERGRSARSVRQQFDATVAPMHVRFVEPQADRADVVLHQPYTETEIAGLQGAIRGLFERGPRQPPWLRNVFTQQLQDLLLPAAA